MVTIYKQKKSFNFATVIAIPLNSIFLENEVLIPILPLYNCYYFTYFFLMTFQSKVIFSNQKIVCSITNYTRGHSDLFILLCFLNNLKKVSWRYPLYLDDRSI